MCMGIDLGLWTIRRIFEDMITCPVTGKVRYTDYCCNLRTLGIDPHYQRWEDVQYACAVHYVQINDIELYCINNEGDFLTDKDFEICLLK